MACIPGTSVVAEHFTITFVEAVDVGGGIVRWCWDIAFTGDTGPALSHWDIQTCPSLSLAQLTRFTVTDVVNNVVIFDTSDPAEIAQFIEFALGFPDGFAVYGMKTDLEFTDLELEPGDIWRFCYYFNEAQVPLTPVEGFVATKSGAGQAADAIVFGLCTPGCDEAVIIRSRRGYRV